MNEETYDVIVSGAGPAGTTAAIYTARSGLSTLLLDKARIGGALGMAHQVANYPGLGFKEPLSGAGLLELMHAHAESFGVVFRPFQVYGFELSTEPFRVITATQVYQAKALVIAAGARSRSNWIPGERELVGHGVAYCATCDGPFFADKDVAVVGNSEEAVTEALVLAGYVSHIFLINPTSRFLAEDGEAAAVTSNEKIEVLFNSTIQSIEGDGAVTHVQVAGPQGAQRAVPVQGVFLYLAGNKPATDFLDGQLTLDQEGYIVTGPELDTSVPGVYAAGDVRGNRLRQVVIATADGAMAAMAIDRRLRKRAKLISQR
ncbi:MAG: FAD-dependent oxidoreductase [Chloroflexi bacterium]|nr:FAD-dependent oxidoreductase [Chloroflexota bacterium]